MRTVSALSTFLLALPLVACSAILGLQEPTVDNTLEGGTDAQQSDAPLTEGSTDTGVDANCNADLQTNKQNCGACGHDCQGGDCQAGKCQPVAVLFNSSLYSPVHLAIDASNIYFTNPYYGTVTRVGKDGSNPTTIATGLVQPWDIAVTSAQILIADSGTQTSDGAVLACPIAGCGAGNVSATKFLTASSDSPSYLTVDGTQNVYISFEVDQPNGRVMVCSLPSCNGGAKNFATNMDNPSTLHVQGSSLYWSVHTGVFGCSTGTVPCASPSPLITNDWGVLALTVDPITLYWGTLYDGTGDTTNAHISLGAIAGTQNPTQVATAQHLVIGMSVDTSNVYWITRGTDPNYSDAIVARCPKAGCGANNAKMETLASGLHDGRAIVDDGPVVYFTTYGDGTIWKLAK